jgi:hypothetical protein
MPYEWHYYTSITTTEPLHVDTPIHKAKTHSGSLVVDAGRRGGGERRVVRVSGTVVISTGGSSKKKKNEIYIQCRSRVRT